MGDQALIRIPEKGLSEDEVFKRLTAFSDRDIPWREGKTLAYIYDGGPDVERVAKRAYMQYLTENALDPTVYPSLPQIENELVSMAASLLGGDENVVGNFVTGGTEGCLLAVKTARDWFRAQHPDVKEPEIVLPVTAHAAFHKGADYFGLKKVMVPVDSGSFKAIPAAIEKAITGRTALIVASACSYAHGVVDPVPEIAAIAKARDVLFHVDGAIGGFVLPYFKRLGAKVTPFDFSVPGVTSITMDYHKYAYCPKGAAIILYRNKDIRRFQLFATADWTGYTLVNPSITSARSGGPMAAAWAVLNFVGDNGYLEFARRSLEATRKIVAGIRAIPHLKVLGEPESNLVAFTAEGFSVFPIIDEMKERGWYIQPQFGYHGSIENIHLSIGQSALEKVDGFLKDLAASAEAASKIPQSPVVALVKAELAKMQPGQAPDRAMLVQLMQALGVQGARLPSRGAALNQVLNVLPPNLTKLALTEYFNDLFVQPR